MAATPVRVCVRVNNAYTSDLRVRRSAEALVADGYDVTVIADRRGDTVPEETLDGVKVKRVSKTSRIPFRSLVDPLVAERADIYHAHDVDSLLPCAIATRRVDGARVVYDSHELWSAHARDKVHAKRRVLVALEGPLLRRCAALITASPAYTEEILKRHGFTGPSETILNAPAYRHDEELQEAWSLRESAAGDRIQVVAVSVFQQGRGAVPLVQSLEFLPEHVSVSLVGPFAQADYEALVRDAARRFGDRVTLEGPIPAERIVPRLAEGHVSAVLIEPISLSYRLTSPNKLYDSLMAGTPMVGSDFPVIGGVITREHAGVTCDPTRPADIARAISEVVDDRVELGKNARDAAQRYSWAIEREKLLALYRQVLSGAGTGDR